MASILSKLLLLAIVVNLSYYGTLCINEDGVALLAFKVAMLEDPFDAMANWNASDENPCTWNGVSCMPIGGNSGELRVVGLSLPKKQLVGIIPSVLGSLVYLRHVNLRRNMLNGSLPKELFSARALQSLVFYGNGLCGRLHVEIGQLTSLQILDLSENSFVGTIPPSIKRCTRLRRLILNNNNLSGAVPQGLGSSLSMLQQLDLSHNLLSGSIPADLGKLSNLQGTLKLSNNFFSGPIPPSLGDLPEHVSIDLTYNNLTGTIPQNGDLANQGPTAFVGNAGLCGAPLRKPCEGPPSGSAIGSLPSPSPSRKAPSGQIVTRSKGLGAGTIVAIAVGDAAGIALISFMVIYCCWRTVSRRREDSIKEDLSSPETERGGGRRCDCLRKGEDSDVYSENVEQQDLVALDPHVGFDLDELLRASAFVLGKSGVGIVYKVVLEDGLTLAVRRLGEGGSQRYKEFQAEVEAIGRIRHPNILALRAYYWSVDEKLLIYDYIPNGTLACALHGRGAASAPLLWAARLKIAKGIAKGLAYLHEFSPKKYVHGDLKPTNILLGLNMEPYIADFGLGRLANIAGSLSMRQHGIIGTAHPESKQSLETQLGSITAGGLVAQGVLMSPGCAYQAPEVPKILKPTQKWDVYSFGVILFELLSGKSPIVQVGSSEIDLVRWVQICIEEKKPLPDILDPALLDELHREEEILGMLKIALACVQCSPDRRPSMKNVAELLEKVSGPL